MAVTPYYAQYCRFETVDKSGGALLVGADCLVGDLFDIAFEINPEGKTVAKLVNKFGKDIGVFDDKAAYRLQICKADGWELHAILSAVFLRTDENGDARYSGEAVVMCFSERFSNEFHVFMNGISRKIADGKRPAVDLKPSVLKTVIESGGEWVPSDNEPKRKLEEGTVVVKDYLKHDEKMIEMARDRNPGCMIIGWAFIIALIAGAIWLVTRFIPLPF